MNKKQKGFTLIELLVVVAIIGILAAVGVVAYSGYTSSAKKSAAKSNHSAVLKYVAAEMKKCNIGTDSGKAMKDSGGTEQLTCSQVGSVDDAVGTAAVAALNDFKNSYGEVNSSTLAVQTGTAAAPTCSATNKGQTLVFDDKDTIYVYTCATDDGTTANGNLLSNQATVE